MSTATIPMFKAATNPPLPRKACIGYVGEVRDGVITKAGTYSMVTMVIEPTQAGQKAYINLLFRPEWLEQGFEPDSLLEYENGKSLYAVYRTHIGGTRDKMTGEFITLPTIAGICGNQDNFNELQVRILTTEGEKTPEVVSSILQQFVAEVNPECGYILKEKEELSPVTNQKEKTGRYEVGSYFFVTDSNKQKLAKQAAAQRLVLAFDPEV